MTPEQREKLMNYYRTIAIAKYNTSTDYNCFLDGIRFMLSRVEPLIDALERIERGTHEEHPTCMAIHKTIGGVDCFEIGPPRTDGWEGWAREIDQLHKEIAKSALHEVGG